VWAVISGGVLRLPVTVTVETLTGWQGGINPKDIAILLSVHVPSKLNSMVATNWRREPVIPKHDGILWPRLSLLSSSPVQRCSDAELCQEFVIPEVQMLDTLAVIGTGMYSVVRALPSTADLIFVLASSSHSIALHCIISPLGNCAGHQTAVWPAQAVLTTASELLDTGGTSCAFLRPMSHPTSSTTVTATATAASTGPAGAAPAPSKAPAAAWADVDVVDVDTPPGPPTEPQVPGVVYPVPPGPPPLAPPPLPSLPEKARPRMPPPALLAAEARLAAAKATAAANTGAAAAVPVAAAAASSTGPGPNTDTVPIKQPPAVKPKPWPLPQQPKAAAPPNKAKTTPTAAPTATPAKGTPTAGNPTATASPDDSPDFEEDDGPPAGVTDEEALASRLAEYQLQLASLIDVLSQVDSLVQQNIDTGATALAKPAGPASGSPSEPRSDQSL